VDSNGVGSHPLLLYWCAGERKDCPVSRSPSTTVAEAASNIPLAVQLILARPIEGGGLLGKETPS
jgi:hypothetical protein